jgi:hypothetical protein
MAFFDNPFARGIAEKSRPGDRFKPLEKRCGETFSPNRSVFLIKKYR